MSGPLEINDIWLQRIKQSVEGLLYGNVQIIVHDGRIVQIERTERKRFDAESSTSSAPVSAARGKKEVTSAVAD